MLFRINVVLIISMSFIHLSGQTLPEGFVFLENEIPNLIVDLRYSKAANPAGVGERLKWSPALTSGER